MYWTTYKYYGGSLKAKKFLILDVMLVFLLWNWSKQCDYIFGVDGRQSHIHKANFVFEVKGIDKKRYDFKCGNIYDLDFKSFGEFDIVICLGFFIM